MKLNKFFLMGAIAIGLVACTNDDVPKTGNGQSGDSYASVTIKFPGTVTKSLPGDYNDVGTWTGRDNLNDVTVFLVNTTKGVVDYNSFAKSSFNAIDANGVLTPNLALKATSGDNVRVYAVINGNSDIISTLKSTSAANFANTFAGQASKIASQVANYDGGTGKETIMMTNDVDNYVINVAPGIDETSAKTGTTNHATVQVERVVSRGMVTVAPKTDVTAWTVKAVIAGVETPIATVTDVTYAVGQSNTKFYIMKKSTYETPDPVYTFNPAGADWTTNSKTYFDYSGLTSFTPVQEFTYNASQVATPLTAETTSKFVLPVTHKVDAASVDAQREFYKKGNTTYFEVRAKFKPINTTLADGTTYTDGQTVYWGANDSKFYSTRTLAEAQGQKATEFKNSVMKYVIWLNPNSLVSTATDPNPKVSPTVNNQVYHAHISGFLRMGLPNNPLNPGGTPGNPNDPNNPADPNDPNNPDNPLNPNDPLKSDYTYLSVSVKVLPWTMHSYTISLDPGIY